MATQVCRRLRRSEHPMPKWVLPSFLFHSGTQTNGPPAGYIRNIFATPEGAVYAVASSGLYRLTEDATAWTHIDGSVPIDKISHADGSPRREPLYRFR